MEMTASPAIDKDESDMTTGAGGAIRVGSVKNETFSGVSSEQR